MMVVNVAIDDVLVDTTLYPRASQDRDYVAELADAVAAGETLPPIVVERGSLRLVDGRHRLEAHKLAGKGVIAVHVASYADDVELFLDGIRRNARHGLRFDDDDLKLIARIGTRVLKVDRDRLAAGLAMTKERLSSYSMRKKSHTKPTNGGGASHRGGDGLKATSLAWGGKNAEGSSRHNNGDCVDQLVRAFNRNWWPNDERTKRQLLQLAELLNYNLRQRKVS